MKILTAASFLALFVYSTVANSAQSYTCPNPIKMTFKYYSGTASCTAYWSNYNGQVYPINYSSKVVSKFVPETLNSKVNLSTTINGKKVTCTANVPFKRQETINSCLYY